MRAYLGAGLIFLGTVIMEIDFNKIYIKLKERRVRKMGNWFSEKN